MLELLWLIPVLTFTGATLNGLFGAKLPKSVVTAIGVGFPGAALLVALGALWQFAGTAEAFSQTYWSWTAGPLTIPVAFLLDRLSAVMLFVVTFVGFWIRRGSHLIRRTTATTLLKRAEPDPRDRES